MLILKIKYNLVPINSDTVQPTIKFNGNILVKLLFEIGDGKI